MKQSNNKFIYYYRYDTALKDIDDAILKNKRQDVPLFLLGHSMVMAGLIYKCNFYSLYDIGWWSLS